MAICFPAPPTRRVGAAIYVIANGATGADATVLGLKIQATDFFTTKSGSVNLGTTQPLDPAFVTMAHNAVAPVVDAASEQAAEQATDHLVHFTGPGASTPPAVQLVGQAHDTTHAVQQVSGFLGTQTRANQVESLYVANFNRAAEGPGSVYWDTGQPVQVAQSFVVQPEAAALGIPADHTNLPAVTTLIQVIYGNLFSHAAAAGLVYWTGQITSGAVSLGAATYIIANGATGADATVLGLKIQAALAFTQDSYQANLGATTPLDAVFLTLAHNAVAPVVDSASLQTSLDASNHLIQIQPEQPAVALVGQADTTHAVHHV
jgi:hypothetical protein